jgi:fructose-1,6-bisphosphatase/inositol monophosphatase family enzyme
MQSTSATSTSEIQNLRDHAASIDGDLGTAFDAAAAAGKIIAEGFGKFHTIDQKGVGDFVSEVDQMADKVVCDILANDSDTAILSEELHPELADGVDDFWIVDPLDATSAFLMQAGRQFPSVLIGKCVNGQAVLGLAHFPLTGEWFYGYKSRNAFKNGQLLRVPDTPSDLGDVWVEMNQYGDSKFETRSFTKLRDRLRTSDGARMVTTTVPNSGVALRVAEAETGLAAAIHDNSAAKIKQAPWDVVPVKLILEEAGGVFLNLQGEPIDPFVAEVSVIAQSRDLAEQIIRLAQK